MSPDQQLADQAARAHARAEKKTVQAAPARTYCDDLLDLHEDSANTFDQANLKFIKKLYGIAKPTPKQIEPIDALAKMLLEGSLDKPEPKRAKSTLTESQKAAQKALRAAAKAARQADLAAQVQVAAEKRVLLDVIMPNELPLRKCTGTYAKRIGGQFQKIGEIAGKAVIETVPAAIKFGKAVVC